MSILHKELQKQFDLNSKKIAIKTEYVEMTYDAVEQTANQIAYTIKNLNTNSLMLNKHVALLFDHGPEAIVSVFGVIKSHNVYVPIPVDLPFERISYIITHAQIDLVLTLSQYAPIVDKLKKENLHVIYIDDIDLKVPANNPILPGVHREILYLLYTSGSTGKPKAVIQTSQNVLYYIDNLVQRIALTASDKVIMFSNFAYDAGVVDIFSAFLTGATLYPYSLKNQTKKKLLSEFLLEQEVTVWHSVPSLYRQFIDTLNLDAQFPDLRVLLMGGETVRNGDVLACRKYFPNAAFVNIYGQTESSINSLWVLPQHQQFDYITLGEPITQTKIYIVQDDGNEVETMGTGQIVVAGDYIASGYWQEPEMTRQVFSEDLDVGKLYWTGDLGRLLPDNEIEFVGRKDHQIKIRGHRVELGEIEKVLCMHPAIKNAVVVFYHDSQNEFLSCYWEVSNCQSLQERNIKAYLLQYLPEYMIPQRYLTVSEWPLNTNGKINRLALPQITITQAFPLPIQPTEIEAKLLTIWKQVLQIESVPLHTNFFDIGGNSLKMLQLQSKYAEVFSEVIPLVKFFEYPSIKEFVNFLSKKGEEKISTTEKKQRKNKLGARKQRICKDTLNGLPR